MGPNDAKLSHTERWAVYRPIDGGFATACQRKDVPEGSVMLGEYATAKEAEDARARIFNKASKDAHDRRIDEMVRQKAGYNEKLGKTILKRLRVVYPSAIDMPAAIIEHPSYTNTLIVLVERGWIDHVQLVRTMNGRAHISYRGRMALSEGGLAHVNRRVNWNTVASVVAAVAAVVGAVSGMAVLGLRLLAGE